MRASPTRPWDDVSGHYAALDELIGDAPDFLDIPAEQILMVGIPRSFLGRHVIGPVPDHRHHSKGEHDEGDMAMPAMHLAVRHQRGGLRICHAVAMDLQ
jgi:hypothetical protein